MRHVFDSNKTKKNIESELKIHIIEKSVGVLGSLSDYGFDCETGLSSEDINDQGITQAFFSVYKTNLSGARDIRITSAVAYYCDRDGHYSYYEGRGFLITIRYGIGTLSISFPNSIENGSQFLERITFSGTTGNNNLELTARMIVAKKPGA